MSIERTVALLTPVFAAVAGMLFTLLGSAVNVPRSTFVALFVAGAAVATSAALKWLHGRQKHVAQAAVVAQPLAPVSPLTPVTNPTPPPAASR